MSATFLSSFAAGFASLLHHHLLFLFHLVGGLGILVLFRVSPPQLASSPKCAEPSSFRVPHLSLVLSSVPRL